MTPMVEIRNVHKSFHEVDVLNGITLSIAAGEVVCFIGPSGTGKSTLLRCVNHLETLDRGRIYIDGVLSGCRVQKGVVRECSKRELAEDRRQVGMVFQSFDLFSHLSVAENIMLAPQKVKGLSRAAARSRAFDLLGQVGLADRADAMPHQMSGGQQQRVAIARALAMEPKVMLFDEPTSALDPELVGEVLDVVRSLARGGMTMLIVTHEIEFARDVADTVVFIDGGRVVEQGPARDVLARPKHSRLQAFLSRSRLRGGEDVERAQD